MNLPRILCAIAVCCAFGAASGQVTTIGPFTGDLSEPFNTSSGSALENLDIFGGAARIQAPPETPDFTRGSIKVEAFSALCTPGCTELSPHTGPWMVSVLFDDGDPRPATIFFFDDDVHRFGGYFGNNSPTDDAEFRFYTGRGDLIGTFIEDIPSAANHWSWHGWQSTVPIKWVEIKGLSPAPFSGGFIWFDDLELAFDGGPLPGACCIEGAGCMELMEPDCLTFFGATFSGDGSVCSDLNGNGTADACESGSLCVADCGGLPDAQVDIGDLLDLLANWGEASACDIAPDSGDGTVGIDDLLALLAAWGPCD